MINQFLRFTPILKEKIWGGNKLVNLLHKNADAEKDFGESWEISGVKNNISVVSNGELKGETLDDLITKFTSSLVGEKVYKEFKNKFPLLIKFIDAKEKLSIQVHPDDVLSKQRHDSFGKTEMWYVVDAKNDAEVVVGFKNDTNKEEYQHHLKNKSLLSILNIDTVKKDDVYFIPTGRIHAIGSGILLAEIQQTSDNTYRVYDWDRKDANGKQRELHTDLATEAIDYSAQKEYKTLYETRNNESSEIVNCPYFTTNVIELTNELHIDHSQKDSFVIYMCVEGEATFSYKNEIEELQFGETILVPNCINNFSISTKSKAKLLEVYLK